MSSEYWMRKEAKEVAGYLEGVRRNWSTFGANPIYQSWVRNMIAYYSPVLEPNSWDTALMFVGEQGELVKMIVPQARSLIRQLVALVTKQRLSFSCIAESSKMDVIKATRLGNSIANEWVHEKDLDKKAELLAEQAAVYGMSFLHPHWRSDKGVPFVADDDSGRVLYEGRTEFAVRSCFDLNYDYRIDTWEDHSWCEVRTTKNRWDLIAQFPELKTEIMALPTVRRQVPSWTFEQTTFVQDDCVYVYEAYHKPTPAIPQGRMVVFGDNRTIFYDDYNPYGCIPIVPCIPEQIHSLMFGFPVFSNLLGCQEMLDHSMSAIATNQSSFAVQNICAPRNAALSVDDIGGMNWISFTPQQGVAGGGKPEPLQLCQSSPETFKFAGELKSHMMEIIGINSSVRGEPPAGVNAGVAIATLTANALEFLNSFTKAWTICIETTMDMAMQFEKKFAALPRPVTMNTKKGAGVVTNYTNEDLEPIAKVKMTLSNPLMQTLAGRSDVAEKLLQNGMIKNMQDYFSVIEGGQIEQMYDVELSENDLIAAENEALTDLKPVKALASDDHACHIRKHISLLNSPEARLNGKFVQNVLMHVQEHSDLAKTSDPFFIAMVRTGKQPPAPPPMQQNVLPSPGGEKGGLNPPPPEATPEGEPAKPAQDMLNRGV